MTTVKFLSVNEADTTYYPKFQDEGGTVPHKLYASPVRTVTMEVDGVAVTRKMASNVTDTDAYIKALAKGLAAEYADKPTAEDTTFNRGDVLVESVVDDTLTNNRGDVLVESVVDDTLTKSLDV